jgi:hypothetical protein
VHEGSRQTFLALNEQGRSEAEKAAYYKEFQQTVIDEAEKLFNKLQYGLAERCLAVIVLLHLYGAMVDAVEENTEVQALKGWFIHFKPQ